MQNVLGERIHPTLIFIQKKESLFSDILLFFIHRLNPEVRGGSLRLLWVPMQAFDVIL